MMLTTITTEVRTVHLGEIDWDDKTYLIRNTTAEFESTLLSDLKRNRQKYPVSLLEKPTGGYTILDGFARAKAILTLANKEGIPAAVQAEVFPQIGLTPQAAFERLCLTNMSGPYAYGAFDKGRFFSLFLERGLTIREMASHTKLTPHEVEDWIEIGQAPMEVGALLNDSKLNPLYIAMLTRHARGWLKTRFQKEALETVKTLIDKGQTEVITMKIWRFYLDFFWNGDRPFMAR
jgi:hypothetical protein